MPPPKPAHEMLDQHSQGSSSSYQSRLVREALVTAVPEDYEFGWRDTVAKGKEVKLEVLELRERSKRLRVVCRQLETYNLEREGQVQ